jgi:hypothetical protein
MIQFYLGLKMSRVSFMVYHVSCMVKRKSCLWIWYRVWYIENGIGTYFSLPPAARGTFFEKTVPLDPRKSFLLKVVS